MLGSGILVVGVPLALATTWQANQERKGRGFVYAAVAILAIQGLIWLAAMALRFFR